MTRIKITSLLLFLFTFLLASPLTVAAPKIVPVEGVSYIINSSMMDNLVALTGKKVMLTLDGGITLTGSIKSVGEHVVHLEKIERKELFDSLIRIENIQAIEMRFREYQ